jgi:hypothetical protein
VFEPCSCMDFTILLCKSSYTSAAAQERARWAHTQEAAYAAQFQPIPEQDARFTEAEVQQGLRRLANDRAPGHEALPVELLEKGGALVLQLLAALVTCILHTGRY